MTANKKNRSYRESKWDRWSRQIYEENGGDLNSDFRHSTYYHSYFSGYAEKLVPRRGGRGAKIERVYVGNTYCFAGSDAKYRLTKLSRLAIYFLSVILFLLGAVCNVPSNLRMVPALLCAMVIIMDLICAAVVVEYLCTPKEMTEHEYIASHKRLKMVSMILAILQLLCCAAKAAALLGMSPALAGQEAVSLALTLCSAAAMALLNRTENALPFSVTDSPNTIPEGSNIIR